MRYPLHETYLLRQIFSNNYDGNKYISFQNLQENNLEKNPINFYGTYEIGLVIIDITMACDIYLVCFFSTKTMGVMKIHYGHRVGKYDP